MLPEDALYPQLLHALIIIRKALSRGETEKKVGDGSLHVACTLFSFDFQGLCGLGVDSELLLNSSRNRVI